MQGAINNIQAVERWFRSNEAPFYTLSYFSTQSTTGQGLVIGRNIKEADIDTAWSRLRTLIEDQTGQGRAMLNLIVYDKPAGANTPSGRTNIDIVSAQSGVQSPGIGSLPAGYVDEAKIQSILDDREKLWKLQRENDDLRTQMESPVDFWDKGMVFLDKLGDSQIGAVLIAKLMGAPIGPLVAQNPINGPKPQPEAEEVEDVEDELNDLEAVAQANGITLKELLAKTAQLARNQPGAVAMLIK